jgi:hypothetical protein
LLSSAEYDDARLAVLLDEARRRSRAMRRRQRLRRCIGGSAAILLIAGLVGGLTGARGGGNTGQQVQATAFVARVERALASPRQHDIVGYTRAVLPPGSRILLGADYERGGPGARGGLGVGVEVYWSYRGTSTVYGFTRSGRRVFAQESSTVTYGKTVQDVTVAVIYADATWWRATLAQPSGPQASTAPRCGQGMQIGAGGWPAFFRYELRCGGLRMAGRQRVGGVQTVKLTGSDGTTAWVNPVTYLPVRVITGGPEPQSYGFRWLAPTAASLAQLSARVPAGFRQIRPPSTAITP